MQIVLKRLACLCGGAMLLACADIAYRKQVAAPLLDAQEAYLMGRSYHMALRGEEAVQYYLQALRATPTHVAARNGLAALYAEQGYLGKAIALWEDMLPGAQAGAEHAYLFTNIGNAYFLNGDMEKARAALERACLLDPLNPRAWQHLGNTLARLGQHAESRTMLRQAATLQGHDLRSDYALLASADATAQPARPARDGARTEITQTPGGMLVLRRVDAEGRSSTLAEPAVAAAPAVAAQRARLEIRNGNGIVGMARSMARGMGQGDPEVIRLSNQKGYGVKQTRIEYRPAFRGAAQELATRLGSPPVVPVSDVGRADMRLILGRDLAGSRGAFLMPRDQAVAGAMP